MPTTHSKIVEEALQLMEMIALEKLAKATVMQALTSSNF